MISLITIDFFSTFLASLASLLDIKGIRFSKIELNNLELYGKCLSHNEVAVTNALAVNTPLTVVGKNKLSPNFT